MIEGVTLGTYGPWTLVGLFCLFVFTGLLVPLRLHKERIGDKDELIKKMGEALDKRDEQFTKLITQNEVTIKLLEDIKRVAALSNNREVEHL